MLDWNRLADADPRIRYLEEVGHAAILCGANEDTAYCDAKPFIATVAGWRRGILPAIDKPTAMQRNYRDAISGAVAAVELPVLSTAEAYETVCVHFYYAMCDVADRVRA